jgi:putative ATP-binding cassette transporter
MSKLKLRDGLTRDLFNQWLVPRRAFHLSGAGEIGKNPDQRIHEDARHLVELSTDLGIGLLQSTLLLVCFITVLWTASDGVMFSVAGWRFALPGYMVWLALAYAGIGSFGSWRVGRSLVELDAERYAREADLRFALVRVNERAEAIALYGGETDEKDYLNREFAQVLLMMRRLVSGITRLTWVTAGYGWVAIVAPFIVAAPGYFAGSMSLGLLIILARSPIGGPRFCAWRASVLPFSRWTNSAARRAASRLFRRTTTGSCSTKSASLRPPAA